MSIKENPRAKGIDRQALSIAAVQMDANPAPTTERLARAERIVTAAADLGAQLILLPELFNTGYAYNEGFHTRVEALNGITATWMRAAAAQLGIHLGGSLMLLDQGEVYNALLLFSPDGRMWRYDKIYPWGWERGYFRGSRRDPKITIAETDLGNIGFLICWDAAHINLWEKYAGRVDLMVICSCPPDISDPTYHFPNGGKVTLDDLGPLFSLSKGSADRLFGDMINQQAAWLGVPAVNTVGCGHIRTEIPRGRLSLLGYALAVPWLFKYLPQAAGLQMSCDMVHQCKIVDASGEVLARLTKKNGESFTQAEVNLPASRPSPQGPQPVSLLPSAAYFLSDVLLPAITKSVYRKGQHQWGSL